MSRCRTFRKPSQSASLTALPKGEPLEDQKIHHTKAPCKYCHPERSQRRSRRISERPKTLYRGMGVLHRQMSANAVRTGGVISASRNVPSPTGLRGILASSICPHHPLPREFSQRESLEGTAPIAPYRSLPPRGRGTAIAVEGACAISIFAIVVFYAFSLSRLRRQSPTRVTSTACSPL